MRSLFVRLARASVGNCTFVEIMSACACSDIAHPVNPILAQDELQQPCLLCLCDTHIKAGTTER